MKPKYKGWKEGVIAKDLRGVGGHTHRKGSTVRYRRYKSLPDSSGRRYTDFEYHVTDLDNMNLIRTPNLEIEGVELENYWKRKTS